MGCQSIYVSKHRHLFYACRNCSNERSSVWWVTECSGAGKQNVTSIEGCRTQRCNNTVPLRILICDAGERSLSFVCRDGDDAFLVQEGEEETGRES